MEISEKIKKLRTENNLTQDDLALKIHVSRQTISKWENNIVTPNLETLKVLAKVFNIDVIDFIDSSQIKLKEEKYKKRSKRLFYINIILTIMTILSGFILYRGLYQTIPVHYDMFFNVTRYGNKIEYLVIPFLSLIFLGFSIYFDLYLTKNDMYKKQVNAYQITMLIMQSIILLFTVFLGFKYNSNIGQTIMPIISGLSFSILLPIMIFSHPKFNAQNTILGFRTTFTLSNPSAWEKLNKTSSITLSSYILVSYLITIFTFRDWNIYLFDLLFVPVIALFFYHQKLKKTYKFKG